MNRSHFLQSAQKALTKLGTDGQLTDQEKDYYQIHCVRYEKTLRHIVHNLNSNQDTILDIGCYPTFLFDALQQQGMNVIGISSNHEPIKTKNIINLNIETDELPFAENSFDLILMFEVIEHILFHPRNILLKFKKILKPGGKLLISTPNAVHIKHRLQAVLGHSTTFSIDDSPLLPNWENLYFRHNKEFTGIELKKVVADAGFTDIKIEYFNAYTPFREKSARDKLAIRLIKIIGWSLAELNPHLRDTIFCVGAK